MAAGEAIKVARESDGPTRERRGAFASSWVRALIRTSLALLALWTLYLAQRRYLAVDEGFRPGLRIILDSSAWLSFIGIQAVCGVFFGLAACLPFTRMRYAWSRLLVAAVALVPLVHYWFVLAYVLPRTRDIERWWVRDWFWSPQAQFVLATLVGVAIASGLRPGSEDGRPDGSIEEGPDADPAR